MSTASLAGIAAHRATLRLPRWGLWFASIDLVDVVDLAPLSIQQFILADLTLTGFVVPSHGGTFAGASHYWLAGGVGGWRKVLPGRTRRNDAGVLLSGILNDLALETGETIVSGYQDSVIGSKFVRISQEASATMQELVPDAWWIGEDGRTNIGRRTPSAPVISPTAVLRVDPSQNVATLALDELSGIVPEASIAELTAATVVHTLTGASLRTRVWGAQ